LKQTKEGGENFPASAILMNEPYSMSEREKKQLTRDQEMAVDGRAEREREGER
jgi:hypothetical protein